MYGKIFASIYDGSLYDNWQALITFQQMIVLCDADGIIDMTPKAMSGRTGIPIEHIETGIKFLEGDDPESRSPEESGKRIVRLDDHRSWGWFIVNHEKYKTLQDSDTVRAQNRERKRRQRQREAGMDDKIEHLCAYCGSLATGPDHIIPKCNGGDESPNNIVPCCPKCNQHKAHRTLQEFISDPFVDWINMDLIKKNPILRCHVAVTPMSQESRHTDTDTDTDTDTNTNKKIKNSFSKNFSSELAPQPSEPPVLAIQLIHSGKDGSREQYPLFQNDIDEWSKSYPAVDVMQTLRNIREWNLSNPTKNKTKRGIRKHITTWLAREQDRGGSSVKQKSLLEQVLNKASNPKPKTIEQKPKSNSKQDRMFLQFVKRYGKPLESNEEDIIYRGCGRLEKIWSEIPKQFTHSSVPCSLGTDEFIDMIFDELVGDEFEQIKFISPWIFKENSLFWIKLKRYIVDQGYLEPSERQQMEDEKELFEDVEESVNLLYGNLAN